MIKITETTLNQAIAHCRRRLPEEACGIFSGESPQHCTRFRPLANRSSDPKRRFHVDPQEWVEALFELQRTQQHLLGIIHSHPQTLPLPSALDLETYWYSVPSYWIISFMREPPEIKTYRLLDARGGIEEIGFARI